MAVSDFALITLAQVKNELNLTDVNASRDQWLEDKIEETSESFETIIGRRIVAREHRQFLDGTGTSTLWVPEYPIISISTLWDDKDNEFFRDTDIIKPTSYFINKEANGCVRVMRQVGTFQKWRDNIKIHYFAGYAELEIKWGSNQLTFLEVSGGTRHTITIPPGKHDVQTMGSLISEEMNRVGLNTYTVTFQPNLRTYRVTLATGTTGTLQLLTNTGTNALYVTMGFGTSSDLTGATTYSPATLLRPRVPRDLERAAIKTVVFNYDRSNYGEVKRGIKSEQIGDYSISYDGSEGVNSEGVTVEVPSEAMSILSRYRTWEIS